MQLAELHVQISKKQTRLLYINVIQVAVCAIDTARLMDSFLVNSMCRNKYVRVYCIVSQPVIRLILLLLVLLLI